MVRTNRFSEKLHLKTVLDKTLFREIFNTFKYSLIRNQMKKINVSKTPEKVRHGQQTNPPLPWRPISFFRDSQLVERSVKFKNISIHFAQFAKNSEILGKLTIRHLSICMKVK